jgi:hypothetical protein
MPAFFATKHDLVPVLRAVEQRTPVKYVLFGHFPTPESPTFRRGEEIPNLGITPGESHLSCPIFLICDPGLKLNARPINGGKVHSFDQLENPDTITFSTGGVWKDMLLYGTFASCTASFSVSKKLLQRYTYHIRKHFKYIGAYYVGEQAEEMLKQGKRLTLAEQTPRSFDLQLPSLGRG